ncbi:hypothetical protein CFI00_01085 [Nocardioides sp. S5]|uniref:hypothetical protein n=1 Tax=Nocardioides sp. S5 TaxID=2017486 RepID=UPI001A8EAD5B|nr:hypothetical protein [Nocardioides sp. S5]QSR29114.1 hypothetical protein CFI00_01085 [Nocardioides sp. S5]
MAEVLRLDHAQQQGGRRGLQPDDPVEASHDLELRGRLFRDGLEGQVAIFELVEFMGVAQVPQRTIMQVPGELRLVGRPHLVVPDCAVAGLVFYSSKADTRGER